MFPKMFHRRPFASRGPGPTRVSKWHALVASFYGALVAGFVYSYSTYSNALQQAFQLSEADKSTLGMAAIAYNFCSFTNGLVLDRTSVQFCCVLGGLIMMASYGLFGAIALHHVNVDKPVLTFCALMAMGNYGASFLIASTYTVLAKNFTEDRSERSAVVSIVKSWQGIASGVGTAIFVGFLPNADSDPGRLKFLYFLAVVGGGIPILISPVLRVLPLDEPLLPQRSLLLPRSWWPIAGSILSLMLIVLTLSTTVHKTENISIALIGMLASPLILLLPRSLLQPLGHRKSQIKVSILEEPENRLSVDVETHSASPWEGGPCDMIRRPEFYILWLNAFSLQSGGLFLTTNLGSMVASRTGWKASAASAVTIFSCTQSLARLVTGVLSNILVKHKLPRTLYLIFLAIIMAFAHGVLCLPGATSLYLGTAMGGFAFGSSFPLFVIIVAEIFGSSRVASNYMIFDGTPGGFGALIFAKALAQHVYSLHQGSDGKCHGDECFRLSHAVVVVLQLTAIILGVILSLRVHHVYQGMNCTKGKCAGNTCSNGK